MIFIRAYPGSIGLLQKPTPAGQIYGLGSRSYTMAELKYRPVPHNRKAFLAKARARKGFSRAYNALALEYQVAWQIRSRT